MNTLVLKIIFLGFLAFSMIIRWPYKRYNIKNKIVKNEKTSLEKGLLTFGRLGIFIIPITYAVTPLLDFANFQVSKIWGWIGIALYFPFLWLFYRSHKDLGKNFSPTLQIREGHNLVTNGIYKYMRHPMYCALWLWTIVQALLLHNYIAGFSGIVSYGLLYLLRVKKEEGMMIKQFGQQYKDYMAKTGRLFPKLRAS